MASWSQVTVHPSDTSVEALRNGWRWLLGDDWTPLMLSAIGDVFVELNAGTVWWLSTATGALEQIASSREQFRERLGTDAANEWFLPGLIDALIAQGKVLEKDQCYTFAIFPIFLEGSFSAENMHPASAAAHFTASGHIHESIRQLPDGAQVQLRIAD